VRLEHFRAQQELARNFYDDNEFCPLRIEEEVSTRVYQHTFFLNFFCVLILRLPNIEKGSRSVHHRSLRQLILHTIIPSSIHITTTTNSNYQDLLVPVAIAKVATAVAVVVVVVAVIVLVALQAIELSPSLIPVI
jgi:hypothetical protein